MIAFALFVLFVVAGILGVQTMFGLEFKTAASLFGATLVFLIGLVTPNHPQYYEVKSSPTVLVKYIAANIAMCVFAWILGMIWDGWSIVQWINIGGLAAFWLRVLLSSKPPDSSSDPPFVP